MIPRVAQLGTSFMGAGAYYLHDVRSEQDEPIRHGHQIAPADYYLHDKGAQTAKRVAYTETLNLPTRDPEKAMKVMAWTAAHSSDIRQSAVAAAANAAGLPYDEYVRLTNPFRGRKGSKCVYAYSLAWSPDQEPPSTREMAAAAKETLKTLGMESHQAVLVVHSDKAHPHIHVVVNRVHPRTGLYADYSRDRLRLSAWAEAYERRTGRILCWERVENNRRRGNGEFVRHEPISRADHEWWQKHKGLSPDAIRSSRALDQTQDRMMLKGEIKRRENQMANWAYRTLGPEIDKLTTEIARNEAVLAAVKNRPRSKSVFRAVANALKRAAIKVFGREKRAKGLLPRLKASLQAVETRKDAEVKKHAAWQQRATALLAARHKLEKTRDEDRIRRLVDARTARGTTERARGAFNVRSNKETAQQFRRHIYKPRRSAEQASRLRSTRTFTIRSGATPSLIGLLRIWAPRCQKTRRSPRMPLAAWNRRMRRGSKRMPGRVMRFRAAFPIASTRSTARKPRAIAIATAREAGGATDRIASRATLRCGRNPARLKSENLGGCLISGLIPR